MTLFTSQMLKLSKHPVLTQLCMRVGMFDSNACDVSSSTDLHCQQADSSSGRYLHTPSLVTGLRLPQLTEYSPLSH